MEPPISKHTLMLGSVLCLAVPNGQLPLLGSGSRLHSDLWSPVELTQLFILFHQHHISCHWLVAESRRRVESLTID